MITLAGLAFAIYRFRIGTPLYRYMNCEISDELSKWFCICYVLVVIVCVILIIANAMMLTANRNIREAKAERRWRLKLADESVSKIIKKLDDINLTEPLENFKQLSLKFHHAIENATPFPFLGNMVTRTNEDFESYKNDIGELLETFSYCNAYLLHFLDSWRYYDTNATKFAKHVDTMESRYALESVRKVRTDFSNIVYKVIQQNRAFYHYHQGIHRSTGEMPSGQVFEKEKKLQFETNLDLNLENVKKKLGKIGTRLQEHSIMMKEAKENLRDAPKGAGYIEFADTLLGFGNFICIIMLLIVFLSLLFTPLWYCGRFYCSKCEFVASGLPLTTAALIFTFYLAFVLTIMYYFLYGMVASDGICGGKRTQASHRSNIIDDCLNDTAIFETHPSAEYRIETGNIEAVLSDFENLSHRMKHRSTPINVNRTSKFQIFHINKTIIQDIYVEMLKVSVYAPKNIEPFATLWQAHRLSENRALRELNCTHAIGHTMVISLHGQIANEMDKLYRMTWRIESLLQDLPHQPLADTYVNMNFSSVLDLSRNLRRIFNKEREQLDRSVYRTSHSNVGSCKTVALLYKTLATIGCDCLVPSMNLFWFGALVAVCLILLLLALLLCQEEMIRRSCSLNIKSRKRLDSVEFAYIDPDDRRHSQTRSSSRPGTSHSTHNSYTPYSTRTGTSQSTKRESSPQLLQHSSQYDMRYSSPYFERRSTAYSNHADTPYASHTNTPYSTRATTPFSSRPETPYNSHRVSPHSSRRATPAPSRRDASHSSHYGTPNISKHASPGTLQSTRDKSIERTPTRGTSLALKLPPDNESFLSDYKRFGVEDPFVEQFTERLSRRDMLPRRQQRKQQYPSEAQHDLRDYSKYESFPEPATGEGKHLRTLRPNKLRVEPRSVWKNSAFRYPGLASSDISANQPTRMPTSISKVIEQRAKTRPKHMSTQLIPQEEANVAILTAPTTSRANAQLQFPPGKIGIVVCPCGCGKPSKIYGTREDIERIRKAGHVCIAKRSAQLRNKHLRPLASVVQLEEEDQGDEDMA